MLTDNTAVEPSVVEALEIKDQDTLDQALGNQEAPVNDAEETTDDKPDTPVSTGDQLILGKYKTVEDLEAAYKNIQSRATKAEQELKKFQKEKDSSQYDKVKQLDWEQQAEFYASKLKELEEWKSQFEESAQNKLAEQALASDEETMEKFISSNPILVETGMDEAFRLVATHPSMQEYSFDSIFDVKFKPKIEKLMGTKVTVKQKPLVGKKQTATSDNGFGDVSTMSNAQYEKNREKILAEAGIKL